MIFVTVGTHEQQFNRLIKYVDELKQDDVIKDEVVMQIGFSTYEPQYCMWKKMFYYKEMVENVEKAEIVITHGGPSSFIMPLQLGKIPIVVPRQKAFGEHINNHQVSFTKVVSERQGNILVVEDINELKNLLVRYQSVITTMSSDIKENNRTFNTALMRIVNEMMRQ